MILDLEAIAEGYKNPDQKQFNLMPSLNDKVVNGALIKYRANKMISLG